MVHITPEALAHAIEDAGTTPSALALRIGRDKDYIRDFLVGRKKSLKAGDFERIRDELGDAGGSLTLKELPLGDELHAMPVIGTIRAGAWIESYMREQEEQGAIPVGRDPRYPRARQYALLVSGDSMDQKAPDGSYVVCVDFAESGMKLRPGLVVHVEAIEVDKAETTLKEVQWEDGQFILVPRSNNPVYKPIRMGPHNGVDVFVRGVVLSVYKPEKL